MAPVLAVAWLFTLYPCLKNPNRRTSQELIHYGAKLTVLCSPMFRQCFQLRHDMDLVTQFSCKMKGSAAKECRPT